MIIMSTAILTTFYNNTKNVDIQQKNFLKFIEFLAKSHCLDHTYVCEISRDGESCLSSINLANHHIIHNPDPLWHKECGINYLLKILPSHYKKVVVMDCDIILSDNDWLKKTNTLLDTYLMVQPYEYIQYNGPYEPLIDHFYPSMVKHLNRSNAIDVGNPGAAIAYRRSYLKKIGGLFDKCLVGGADSINIMPFYENDFIQMNIFSRVCKDVRHQILNYRDRCLKVINKSPLQKCAYLKNCIAIHSFHGLLKNRKYGSRYDIINKLSLKKSFYKDKYGFYRIEPGSRDSQNIVDNLNSFFNDRMDLTISANPLEDPIIFSTNKHGLSGDIFWLSDYDILTFKNITKAKFYFHKKEEKQINNIQFYHNKQELEEKFTTNSIVMELENLAELMINANYFIPLNDGDSFDIRRLSFYMSKIEIVRSGSETYEEYELSKIL